jgi:hypothetical protein
MIARIGATRNTRTSVQYIRNAHTWIRWLRKASYGDLVMFGASSQTYAFGADEPLIDAVEHKC